VSSAKIRRAHASSPRRAGHQGIQTHRPPHAGRATTAEKHTLATKVCSSKSEVRQIRLDWVWVRSLAILRSGHSIGNTSSEHRRQRWLQPRATRRSPFSTWHWIHAGRSSSRRDRWKLELPWLITWARDGRGFLCSAGCDVPASVRPVFLADERRRLVHVAFTDHPTATRTARGLSLGRRDAAISPQGDPTFNWGWAETAKAVDNARILTTPQSPWQNRLRRTGHRVRSPSGDNPYCFVLLRPRSSPMSLGCLPVPPDRRASTF
jgi:hypothetical protein